MTDHVNGAPPSIPDYTGGLMIVAMRDLEKRFAGAQITLLVSDPDIGKKPGDPLYNFISTASVDAQKLILQDYLASLDKRQEPAPGDDLDAGQKDLLHWLGTEEFNQYGECHGKTLDSLIEKGLAKIYDPGEHQDGFIAQDSKGGKGDMYRAVSLTEAGRTKLREMKK